MSIVTRWSVRQQHPVTAADLDPGGNVSDEALERWVAGACSEYLAGSAALESMRERSGLRLARRTLRMPRADRLGHPATVVVTASATEVRPSAFTVSVRVRPRGGDADVAANAVCEVQLEDPATGEARELGDEVRAELIETEKAARHLN